MASSARTAKPPAGTSTGGKPNILVIRGDDIGIANLNHSRGAQAARLRNGTVRQGDTNKFLPAVHEEFPPRQKAASFTIDQALAKMADSFNSGH